MSSFRIATPAWNAGPAAAIARLELFLWMPASAARPLLSTPCWEEREANAAVALNRAIMRKLATAVPAAETTA